MVVAGSSLLNTDKVYRVHAVKLFRSSDNHLRDLQLRKSGFLRFPQVPLCKLDIRSIASFIAFVLRANKLSLLVVPLLSAYWAAEDVLSVY